MGRIRFLHDQYLSDDLDIECEGNDGNLIFATMNTAAAEGSGDITATGVYTHWKNLHWVLEIDGTGDIGTATFRWSNTGGTSWNYQGETLSAGNNFLTQGVYVNPSAGTGANDFTVGDRWEWMTYAEYSPYQTFFMERNHFHRTAGLIAAPLYNYVKVDLGEAKAVDALAIYDHNFTSSAVIKLMCDSTFNTGSGLWTSPDQSFTIPWAEDKILYYPTSPLSRQYWGIAVQDPSNPDGKLQCSINYLGGYYGPPRNYTWGRNRVTSAVINQIDNPFGVPEIRAYNIGRTYSIKIQLETDDDVLDVIETLENRIDRTTGRIKPVFVNFDEDDLTDFRLMHIHEIADDDVNLNMKEVNMNMSEVLQGL